VWDYIFTENITLSISSLKVRNIVFIVSLIFIFIGAIILIVLANSFGSGWSVACTVSDISNENHEHLEFLTTYIMPLVFTDVDSKRTVLNLGLMIFVIGAIYVKTNRFILTHHLQYSDSEYTKLMSMTRGVKKCTVICRSVLKSKDNIKYIKIDNETYLAKIV
jgi:hypothetical protein